MAFTTDLTTDIGKFRLELGDTTEPALFTDLEVAYFLEVGGTVTAALGRAVDALVLRFARLYDTTIDGQSFSRSQVAAALAKHGQTLSEDSPVVTLFVTRIDANSDTISAEETRALTVGAAGRTSRWDALGYDLDPDHDIPS